MLADQQVVTLRALVNRIIPPDEFPGGWEGGVGDYLFRQFKRDLHDQVGMYGRGLDALDAEARATARTGFTELDAPAQDALLAQVEHGLVQTSWPVDPAVFFNTVVEHSMEGYYADPGNGGNRDEIAWRMIGFEVTD